MEQGVEEPAMMGGFGKKVGGWHAGAARTQAVLNGCRQATHLAKCVWQQLSPRPAPPTLAPFRQAYPPPKGAYPQKGKR